MGFPGVASAVTRMAYTVLLLTYQLRPQVDIFGSNRKNTYYESENLREETLPQQSASPVTVVLSLRARDRIMYFLSGVEGEGGN